MKLGEKIFECRKQRNLSQEQLGEEIGVTRQTVSNWEIGGTSPNPEQLVKLSHVFEISVDTLLGNEENTEKENKIPPFGYEYVSKTKIKGTPFVHINLGLGRGFRKAKGIIAIGDIAKGIISIGGVAMGFLTLGGVSLGILSLGGFALGLILAFGGLSIGSISIGGIAVGLFACGGLALGLYAIGGVSVAKYIALGDYAYGKIAIGNHVKGAVELFRNEVTASQIRTTILEYLPKTWDIIITILSNITI